MSQGNFFNKPPIDRVLLKTLREVEGKKPGQKTGIYVVKYGSYVRVEKRNHFIRPDGKEGSKMKTLDLEDCCIISENLAEIRNMFQQHDPERYMDPDATSTVDREAVEELVKTIGTSVEPSPEDDIPF